MPAALLDLPLLAWAIRALVRALAIGLLVASSAASIAAASGQEAQHVSFRVAYLSDGVVFVVSGNDRSTSLQREFEWKLPTNEYRDYAGLACGSDSSLLVHTSRIDTSTGSVRVESGIVSLSLTTRQIQRIGWNPEIPLTWPRLSRDGAWVAATAIVSGEDRLALLSVSTGKMQVIGEYANVSARDWDHTGEKILVSWLDKSTNILRTAEYDRRRKSLTGLTEGGKGKWSHLATKLAFVSSDAETLVVDDRSRGVRLEFNGFYKDVLGWVNDEVLFYVTGSGYIDQLGLINVTAGIVKTFSLPSVGQVSGGCVEVRLP